MQNHLFREKVHIWVKMPDGRTISIFPGIGTSFSELINFSQFDILDRDNFYLKSNYPIQLISNNERSTTITLIRRLRGGSTEKDKIIAELQAELRRKDEECMALALKVDNLKIMSGKKNKKDESSVESIDIEVSDGDSPNFTIKKPLNINNKKTITIVKENEKEIKPAKCDDLPKYDGLQEWEDWIEEFNLQANLGHWTEEKKIITFIGYLSKDIRLVVRKFPKDELNNFDTLSEKVRRLFDRKKKNPTDYLKELLNSNMKNTKCKNVAHWYTHVINLATLAKLPDLQNNNQVKVALIKGIRPAQLFKDVTSEFKINNEKFMKKFTVDEIYSHILELEDDYLLTQEVYNEGKDNYNSNNKDKSKDKPKDKKIDNNDIDRKNKNNNSNKSKTDKPFKDDPKPDKDTIKKLMPLTIDELREQNRCFFCAKEIGKRKHYVNTCKRAYGKDADWDEVRKQYLNGKSFDEITKSFKKESVTSSGATPKNPKVGLGDGQKK
jgi:hypothetical protein